MTRSLSLFITACLLLLSPQLYAQRLSGIIADGNTLLPVVHATISTPSQTTFTTITGQFTVSVLHKGDTVKITCVGYKPHFLVFTQPVTDTLKIYLEQNVTSLKSVMIIGKRDPKTDSLKLRKEFGQVFDYKAPSFKDIFITRSPYVYTPNDYIHSTNNFNTLLSVNLLSVISMLGKNNAPTSKLQKTLLKEEEYDYIDRVFSKQKVVELTGLKGDSLQNFMDKYRPTAATAKTMTDYDVMIYIKKCYEEFRKP